MCRSYGTRNVMISFSNAINCVATKYTIPPEFFSMCDLIYVISQN
ncbi:hypothetical protein SAMN05444388_101481 [Flavobacterium johnsoniae]|uniref:Uncharacterized protein n=1 Tax=Flavobacterium johnsoniae TaxID=986 RepID=A0A1M5GMS9_FLAJO|nr:hypothetical protein SAMN05444388_101481 [Flavobacterium johnsoniae]